VDNILCASHTKFLFRNSLSSSEHNLFFLFGVTSVMVFPDPCKSSVQDHPLSQYVGEPKTSCSTWDSTTMNDYCPLWGIRTYSCI